MAIRGSCLCGTVEFEIDGKLSPIQICHGSRCQKATGSGYAPELAARRDALRWVSGEDAITRYEAPELLHEPPHYRRAFCRVCGSPVPVEIEGTPLMVMLAGVLDDDPGVRPFREILTAQTPAWDDPAEDLSSFEGRPPTAERIPRKL